MGMRRSSFVLEADRQKLPPLGQRRESRSFTTIDPDGIRESRSYSITDSESSPAGGHLGPRKSISEMDSRDFQNRRKSIYQRRQTARQSMVRFCH